MINHTNKGDETMRANYFGLNFKFASNRFMRLAYAYKWTQTDAGDKYHWLKVAFENIRNQYA